MSPDPFSRIRRGARPIYIGGGQPGFRARADHHPPWERHALFVDGRERHFQIHWPPNARAAGERPVLFAFHAEGGTPSFMAEATGLVAGAALHGVILVFVEGVGRDWQTATGAAVSRAREHDTDSDTRLIAALKQHIVEVHGARPEHFFALGYSKGGARVYRLASVAPALLQGIVVVAGAPEELDQPPASGLSLLHIHGTHDRVYPLSGLSDTRVGGHARRSVIQTIADWVSANDLSRHHGIVRSGRAMTRLRFERDNRKPRIELCLMHGVDHQWPRPAALEHAEEDHASMSVEDLIMDFVVDRMRATGAELASPPVAERR